MKAQANTAYTYNILHSYRPFGGASLSFHPPTPTFPVGSNVSRQAFLFQHYNSAFADKFRRAIFLFLPSPAGLFASVGELCTMFVGMIASVGKLCTKFVGTIASVGKLCTKFVGTISSVGELCTKGGLALLFSSMVQILLYNNESKQIFIY
ncbi:MAG: hypothetical protein LBD21_07455 [Tannerellaceae bacterium]|jgi:hypothetical protein|nr:hypothetical protein [Tannerellaceae bacterium]